MDQENSIFSRTTISSLLKSESTIVIFLKLLFVFFLWNIKKLYQWLQKIIVTSFHYVLLFIKSHSKLETSFGIVTLVIFSASLGTFFYIKTQREAFVQAVEKADTLVYTEHFSQAYDAYAAIKTIFPYQEDIITSKEKNLDKQQTNLIIFKKGESLLKNTDFTQAITTLQEVSQGTQHYEQAQADVKDIQHQLQQAQAIKDQANVLVTQGDTLAAKQTYTQAVVDYQQALKLIDSDPVANKDTTLISSIASKAQLAAVALQKQKDEAAKQAAVYSLRVPILMYHYIRINPNPTDTLGFSLSVTPTDFSSQMNYLATHGYTSITTMDLIKALKSKSSLPPKPVVITFDDGYRDFFDTAFPVLEQYNLKAEAYIIVNFLGQERYMTWDMLHQLIASGLITIGAHTLTHPSLPSVSSTTLVNEVEQSKAILEKELGISVTDFCYPYGAFNSTVVNEVIHAGYTNATTTQYGQWHAADNMFQISRVRVSGGEDLNTFINRL